MSGIIAVYGLVVSVLIAGARKSWNLAHALYLPDLMFCVCEQVKPHNYSLFAGFIHLGAGIACGSTGLAAGYAIGLIGDSVNMTFFSDNCICLLKFRNKCVRAYVHESKVFVSMVLILIFAEVLGLYG